MHVFSFCDDGEERSAYRASSPHASRVESSA
jgi:hypothetical protein